MGIASNFISKNPVQIQVAQGTAPLSVVSTTLNTNFNADMVGGVHLAGLVQTSALGANNGVATLDGTGKLTSSQIPDVLVGAVVYKGVWDANANTPTLASGTGTKGNYYKVSVAGTTNIDGINSWSIGDTIIFDGTTWDKLDGVQNEIISVAGRTGVVTLTSADLTDATTIGKNLVTLANPGAVTFPRFNADNTVSSLDAATFRTAIGAGTGNGNGSVTSVGLSLPSMFTVTNSPVTTSGTLTATLASQSANTVLAAPNGSSGAPTFRTLVAADIPILNQNTTGSAASLVTTYSSIVAGSLTTSSTTAGQVLASYSASTYRSLEVQVQVTQGTNYTANKLLIIHDGTNAYITEYGTIQIGTAQATFDANIVSGNIQVQVTPATTNSTVFKYQATLINI